jgi:ribosomal protein S18 acetylase RimI-like enzyme
LARMLLGLILFTCFHASTDGYHRTISFLHSIKGRYWGNRLFFPPNRCPSSLIRNLTPVAKFDDKIRFLQSSDSYRICIDKNGYLINNGNDQIDGSPFALCIVEEEDLADISRLTVDAFGAATVTLSGELNKFERALIGPTVGLWNAYTDILAYTEVLAGLRCRMKDRLKGAANVTPPNIAKATDRTESYQIASGSSLVLALARTKVSENFINVEPIATVELRLQPTDAKIPFSQPWLDDLERKAAKIFGMNSTTVDRDFQPYLSNLCVAKGARGKKIGTAMVRCVENIAKNTWGYKKIYLHVDLENTAAVNLYKAEGYCDVGFRWTPFWAGKASEIAYFVKKL